MRILWSSQALTCFLYLDQGLTRPQNRYQALINMCAGKSEGAPRMASLLSLYFYSTESSEISCQVCFLATHLE